MNPKAKSLAIHPEFPSRAKAEPPVREERATIGMDGDHRIVLWNRAAERLLGRSAADTLGRRCHEVLDGHDAFGNRFCHAACVPLVMLQRGEAVCGFEVRVAASRGGVQHLRVSTLRRLEGRHAGDPAGRPRILHVIEPADECAAVSSPPHSLTPREREILALVAFGLQNKEIAERLGLSIATVRNHVHNILERLGLHSKLEAVALAYRNGWVDPGALTSVRSALPPAGTPSACTGSSGR